MNFGTSKPRGKRSSKWPALRDRFLKGKSCAVCEGQKRLEAHHIWPFHLRPDLELDPANLIPLCEGRASINCHLIMGHLGNYRSFNLVVQADAARWHARMKARAG